MSTYTLTVTFKSPALIGSGEGFGAVIDTDIVFDEVGIPFVPAKRIKGCLRDSALEVQEMFDCAQIVYPLQIDQAFGESGAQHSAPVYFSNLTIEEYEKNKAWLAYFLSTQQYTDILSRDRILETFTEIRQQTAIGSQGVAYDHSLRTIRVIQPDITFLGKVNIDIEDEQIRTTLLLACRNLRHIGTKRNRGYGEVYCSLRNEHGDLPMPQELEELCIQ